MVTRNERVRVIELHVEGKSYRQIANETGISKDAAREIIKYWTTTGKLNPPSRPGKPPVLSERDIRHLVSQIVTKQGRFHMTHTYES